MSEDALDHTGVDEGDDAQRGTAVAAFERIDFVNFLNQPRPVGPAPSGHGRFVGGDRRNDWLILFGQPSRAPQAVGVVAIVADQVYILVRDVVQERPQPCHGGHELLVAFQRGVQF